LIHVSDMSWTKRVKHPSEVLKKGDVVRARITNIDVENQRVSLSIKEFMPNEWEDFAQQHKVGDVLPGRVVNVTDFGLFIDIYNGLEGLAHISEIDVQSGVRLEDRFAVGDYVRTRILRIEEDEKKVGLSMRGVQQPTPNEVSELKAEAAAKRHHASHAAAAVSTPAPAAATGPAAVPAAPAGVAATPTDPSHPTDSTDLTHQNIAEQSGAAAGEPVAAASPSTEARPETAAPRGKRRNDSGKQDKQGKQEKHDQSGKQQEEHADHEE
jgi:predicted RNA-binding protein with RPS1 domain